MLSVGLLGVFRVADVDLRIWCELGPAARGLASFLFTYPDRGHRREKLAELFWPELDAERARRAMNSAVWRLRKLLATQPESEGGQNLQTLGSETVLKNAPWLDVDIWSLQNLAAPVIRDPAAPLEPHRLAAITAILHRYEGPFLDGDEGDWILEERERLHSIFLRTATIAVRSVPRRADAQPAGAAGSRRATMRSHSQLPAMEQSAQMRAEHRPIAGDSPGHRGNPGRGQR